MRVLISDPIEQQCADLFRSRGFEVEMQTDLPPETLKQAIPDYDALIVRSQTKVTSEIIAAGTRLKVIGRAGAGVDNIDVEAASRRGIIVMNTPGGNTISTAEHTISMLLSLARNIPQADQSVKRGEWNRKKYVGVELYEKTLGILGLGKVGKEVAIRCAAFGMKLVAFDPILSVDAARALGVELVGIEELLRRADIITVHTPLTNETRGILNSTTFKLCKPGVRIINCARGGIIDETALLDALESGLVAGAALDVFATEPPGENPLLRHPAVIVTPHLGASTEEAQEKVAIQIACQVSDALTERGIAGGVNTDVITAAMRSELQPYLLLAEKIGKFVGQLHTGVITALSLHTQGHLLADAGKALNAAFFKGLLCVYLDETINLLNAPIIARERGLRMELRHEDENEQRLNTITVSYETEKERRNFTGTVFGSHNLRLINIDGFHFETNPEGNLLIYSNIDKPGVVAAISTILAAADINIAGMSLGRYGRGDAALAVMSVDSPIPEDIVRKISTVEGMLDVRTVTL